MNKAIIVFSRYPEPGKTKTRMIPALGAEGAANLQRHLTEDTVKKARELRQLEDVEIAIYFAGGNVDLMQSWLGEDLNYYAQVEGDLGLKMQSAFREQFVNNKQIVMIGIDCPGINMNILNSAFTALENNNLVLGEAEDGGYYLIGLNKLIPELFIKINWGTELVFATTKSIAEQLNLAIAFLPVLRDIDRPEDLALLKLIRD